MAEVVRLRLHRWLRHHLYPAGLRIDDGIVTWRCCGEIHDILPLWMVRDG